MHRSRLRTLLQALLIGAFGATLLAPAVDLLVRPDSVRSAARENRPPARFPAEVTGLSTLAKFPAGLESWFDDRLGLRDIMLRGHQALRHFVFHCEASPTLVEGKNNWLFFGADNSVPVQRGMAPFTADDLERWRIDLEARRDWLRKLGIEYVFVIAPNKQSIYPENVPDDMRELGPTRLDQIASYMHAKSDMRFLDLRAALTAEKDHDEGDDCVYYPLGSHWAWRGGWVAWNEIVRSLSDAFPKLSPIPREALGHVEVSQAAGDSMALHTYIDDLVRQRTFSDFMARPAAVVQRNGEGGIVSSTNPDASLPRTFVLHDSFGAWLLPFAAEGSSSMKAAWQHAFPKETLQIDHPDLVVQMYTERVLVWGLAQLAPENDLLDEASFQALQKLWGPIDASSAVLPPVQGAVSLSRVEGGIAVEQNGESGLIELPIADVPHDAELALHIDLTSPAQTVLTFFYQLSQDRRYARSHMGVMVLEPGRNDLRFRLRVPHVWGPMRLRVGLAKGTYVLHSLEARAAF